MKYSVSGVVIALSRLAYAHFSRSSDPLFYTFAGTMSDHSRTYEYSRSYPYHFSFTPLPRRQRREGRKAKSSHWEGRTSWYLAQMIMVMIATHHVMDITFPRIPPIHSILGRVPFRGLTGARLFQICIYIFRLPVSRSISVSFQRKSFEFPSNWHPPPRSPWKRRKATWKGRK